MSSFLEYISLSWDHVLVLALGHALVVAISLAIDIVIGVSLGVLVYRRERAANVALAITSTFLTIPSFALFGLFIPIFGLGYTPAVVALVMCADRLPGVEKTYDFEFPSDNIVKINEGLIYQATNKGDKCNFGEVFATDGRIKGLGLELISDSKGFFPLYNPALTVNKKVLDEYPQIEKIFAPISKKLTTEELQKLNTQVDIDGQLPEDVTQKWLSDNGFI